MIFKKENFLDVDFLDVFKNLTAKNKTTDHFIFDRLSLCLKKNSQALHRNLKIPYLVMDIPAFDWKTMLQEARNLESHSVPHRSDDSQGWNSLCLHGIDAKKTLSCDKYGYLNEEQTPYRWTRVSEKAPVTTDYLKDLINRNYFSKVYRIRFMYLKPGGFIKFHRDREEDRKSLGPLNIALNMPEKCYWLFKEWGQVPFKPGTGLAVDVSNQHGVWNFSEETRIHIIIHGIYGEEYYKTIKRSAEKKLKEKSLDFFQTKEKSDSDPVSKKEDRSRITYLMWLQNYEIKSPELLRITSKITEHFLRLRSSDVIDLDFGIDLTNLLSRAYDKGGKWSFVMTPGNLLKDNFYKSVKTLLSKADPNVFMFAHLMDRKKRWFGIHPQCFIVNLSLWNQTGRPPLIKKVNEKIHLPKVIRSRENIHDDYTPTYLIPGEGVTEEKPEIFGWHWIKKALESGLRIENIPLEIRKKKLFLYPEQNQENLLKCLKANDFSSDKNPEKKRSCEGVQNILSINNKQSDTPLPLLSDHQKKVLDYLFMESSGLTRKMFIFNTESVRNTYVENKLEKIDAFLGLPAGFMDFHTLYRHGFHEETKLVYFDINEKILFFKEKLLELWDGKNYHNFVDWIIQKYPKTFNNSLLTKKPEEREENWKKELEIWGGEDLFLNHLEKVKLLKRNFIKTNLLDDFTPLIKIIEGMRKKHLALWYSNCFNYTPGLAYKNWKYGEVKQQGMAFLNHLLRLSETNNLKITVYGEDPLEGCTIGSLGRDVQNIFGFS